MYSVDLELLEMVRVVEIESEVSRHDFGDVVRLLRFTRLSVAEVLLQQNPLVVVLVEVRHSHESRLVLLGARIGNAFCRIFTNGSVQVEICDRSDSI